MKIYIDGENCRKGLARVLTNAGVISGSREMTSYNLTGLLGDILDTDEATIQYYASEIRLPRGYQPTTDIMQHVDKIRDYTRRWVPALKNQGITYIKAGYLKVKPAKECRTCHTIQEVLQEKGVDVRIATDMLEDALIGTIDTLVIFSSDTDLTPAMHKIKQRGVKIVYICFADAINRAVSAVADEVLTISVAKVKQYSV